MNDTRKERIKAGAAWLAPAFFALYLVSNLMTRSLTDHWIFIGWTALWIGVIFSGVSRGRSLVFISLLVLLGSHALAIPGSIIWGIGNWELTAGVVLWMAPAMMLYLANDAHRVFAWLVPAVLVHGALIIWQGFTGWYIIGTETIRQVQVTGLANNANLAAGFLSLGIIYLMTTRFKWLSLPLLAALLFTGSRWGLTVTGLVLVAMALSGAISWKPLAGAIAAGVLGLFLLGLFTPGTYAVAGYDSIGGAFYAANANIGARLAIPHIPSFLPSGVAEHPGLHNVPLRIAVENGIIAAVIWVVITGWALLGFRKVPGNERRQDCEAEQDHHGELKDVLPNGSGADGTGIAGEVSQCAGEAVRSHRWWLFLVRLLALFPTRSPDSPRYSNNEIGQQTGTTNCRRQANYPSRNVHRWLLLTLVLLSVLDYYTWMGHLGGFWWLLIGLLTKRR